MRFSLVSVWVNNMLDSHCHLNDQTLFPSRKEIIERAISLGVDEFLVIGWDIPSSKLAIQIAHEFPSTYAAIGIHPENLEGISDSSLKELEELSKDPKVKAIGEIGLDYHWYKEKKEYDFQKIWFIKQIELANALHLPLSIHARDASEDTYDILKEHAPLYGAVLHCYSGSKEMMDRFLKLGLYFGFDGPITYKNSIVPKECVIHCPLNRLLSETDSPYLSPIPFRGKTNEPAHIKEIIEQMALLKQMDGKDIEKQIKDNFHNLFHVEQ